MLDERFDLAFEVSLVSFASFRSCPVLVDASVHGKLYTLVNYGL